MLIFILRKTNPSKKYFNDFYFLALELNNTYIGKRYINVTMSKGENKNKRKLSLKHFFEKF